MPRVFAPVVGIAVCSALLAGPACAQEMTVPMELQMGLFSKVLQFDRELDRMGDELVVGVVFQRLYRPSLDAWEEAEPSLTEFQIPERRVRLVPIEWSGAEALSAAVAEHGIDALYVAPLRAVDVAEVATVSASAGVLTFSGVPEYVDQGLSVGIATRGGRSEIVINLEASRVEGARFSAELLQLVRIVRRDG